MNGRPLAPCQCGRWRPAPACTRTATQEDLLCDPCRRGCSAAGFAPVGTPASQIPMTNAHMEQVTTVWGGLLPNDQEAGEGHS
jgi:hypothetical protein